MPRLAHIDDPADARLDDYRHLKDSRLNEQSGKFIAESELVVRRLLGSGLQVQSVLVTATRLQTLEADLLPHPELPVFVVSLAMMETVAGFSVHRGCLAVGFRPQAPTFPLGTRRLVVLDGLVDVDNVGTMIRNAAAFGVDGVLLSPRCADPYYRKAIRVSAGGALCMPIVRANNWPADLVNTARAFGMQILGAVLDAEARNLAQVDPPERFALVLGSEGPGLGASTKAICDQLVTIPMAPEKADSLNVATAGAIFLFALTQPRQSD